MKKLLTCTLLCLISAQLFSAKPPVKFGEIDFSDLEMTTYEHDTSAYAIVLCEYGEFTDQTFTFSHTIRIKILKKEGLAWANHVFHDMPKTSVKGITYNLVDGEIVEDKLKNESVFHSYIAKNYFQVRVAMPNVKVGSVIDIHFSYRGLPYRWYFQRTIPVRWNELVMEPTSYVKFRKNYYGHIPFYESDDYRWVTKDVPAMKIEPYTNSMNNYIAKFEFELLLISFPGYSRTFATEWESISRNLFYYDHYGNNLFGNAFLNSVAKEIETTASDKLKQLELAHKEITNVKWDKNSSLYTTYSNLNGAYNKKIGNSTDINLLLVALLRKLDFEAYPVMMVTRDRGIFPSYPAQSKLNYTICQVILNNEEYLLDATEDLLPYTLLPERCLNIKGRAILKEDLTKEVSLKPKGKNKIKTMLSLNINTDLSISGSSSKKYSEYAAFDYRHKYETEASESDFIESIENSHPGLIVNTFSTENIDDIYNDVTQKCDITFKNAITSIGNKLYVNPMLHYTLDKNPFKVEERLYPVDYAYPYSYTYYIQYTIPDGYIVEKIPEAMRIALPNNSANVTYNISTNSNIITAVYKFNINQVVFLPNEYAGLKQFYSMIIDKHAEPIILTKI